jgi:putative membrane protein
MIEEKDLKQKIVEVEKETDAEIVCVMEEESDNYFKFPAVYATLFMFIIMIIINYLMKFNYLSLGNWNNDFTINHIIVFQVLVWPVLFGILNINPIKRLFTSTQEQKQAAKENAGAAFHLYGLHKTKKRNGILIFVSKFEHYAEIIADEGVDKAAMKSTWDKAIKALVEKMKEDKPLHGFISALEVMRKDLSKHHPKTAKDENEIEDLFYSK